MHAMCTMSGGGGFLCGAFVEKWVEMVDEREKKRKMIGRLVKGEMRSRDEKSRGSCLFFLGLMDSDAVGLGTLECKW